MGLHQRYEEILAAAHHPLTLDKAVEDGIRKKLTEAFDGMMSALYKQKGAALDINILASDEAQHFIETHSSALDSSFTKVEMSDGMRKRLQRSNYIFSGIKTFHELNEAFPSLLDENGNRKTFEQFLNDVQKIDSTYNRNYLRAEYNFVQQSAEMASKWEDYAEDGDRYNLQYRTAGDDKVRPEHAALNGVTLPFSDPFWEEYYPPNGWNCRCTVVQVRKSKYPETPRDEAMARGEEALQKDTKGIFHFNPGKEKKSVPDYNPYTIKRCRDCDVANGKTTLAFIPDYQLCRSCQLIRKCYEDRQKANSENLKVYTPEEKHAIYSQSLREQFDDVVFTSKTGHTVVRHTLKDIHEMDYNRVLDTAKLFAAKNDVKILPEIHKSEIDVRLQLGLPDSKNPDLLVDDKFVDVKSPFSPKNIISNANKACRQGAVACISDHLCYLDKDKIHQYARLVFNDENYTQDTIFFVIENKLYKITTADL